MSSMNVNDFVGWAGLTLGVLGFPAIYKMLAEGGDRFRRWWSCPSYFPRLEVGWMQKGAVLRIRNADRHPVWSVDLEVDPMEGRSGRRIAQKLKPGEAVEVALREGEGSDRSVYLEYRCRGLDRFASGASRLLPRRRGSEMVLFSQIVQDPRVGLEARRATYMPSGGTERQRRARFKAEVRRITDKS